MLAFRGHIFSSPHLSLARPTPVYHLKSLETDTLQLWNDCISLTLKKIGVNKIHVKQDLQKTMACEKSLLVTVWRCIQPTVIWWVFLTTILDKYQIRTTTPLQNDHQDLVCESTCPDSMIKSPSGDSWMYPYKHTPMGNPYKVGIY